MMSARSYNNYMNAIQLETYYYTQSDNTAVIQYHKYKELIDIIGYETFNKTCQENEITVIIGLDTINHGVDNVG